MKYYTPQMFLKTCAIEFCWNPEAVSDVFDEKSFVADLLGSECLFEILQTSSTVKNSENVVKKWMFQRTIVMESTIFLSKWIKEIKSYQEFGFYFKYYTSHPLSELLKVWYGIMWMFLKHSLMESAIFFLK